MSKVSQIRSKAVKVTLDRERTLKFTLNSFAELEEKYGTVNEAMAKLEAGSMKASIFMIWAGLVHEDPELTPKQVGDMIEVHLLPELMESITAAMGQDMPDKEQAPKVPN